MAKLSDVVVFKDSKLAGRYPDGRPISMATLFEAYFDGAIDLPDESPEHLEVLFGLPEIKYDLTAHHLKFLFTNFIPEVAIHSKSQDKRIVREHYDRGNDFFSAFLGERMVYTSGIFKHGPKTESLEEAQDNKMDLVCQKLMLQPGEKLLDIGCGWGTLARHAAKKFGVDSTGVTLAERQTELGNERIRAAKLEDRARVLCMDYREIPQRQFDKIVSLEMVEHVGVKNLMSFMRQVYGMLKDDGLFLLQWTGLRRGGDLGLPVIGLRPEDLVWGLFMNKYIFSGADASLPLSKMVDAMEKAGFEVHSAENITVHYGHTLRAWHRNWIASKAQVLATYGETWYRIWHLFLGWSTRVAFQGNAACFQIVANKNIDSFDRNVFVGHAGVGAVAELPERRLRVQGA
ncbi:MAG: class I SAM-dependent methyltransferase [Myxococcaceae bacterium]